MVNTGFNLASRHQGFKAGAPLMQNLSTAPASYAASQTSYTAADIIGALIVQDGSGGVTVTLPTATALLALVESPQVGDTVPCTVSNGGTGTITLSAGTGGSFDANQLSGSRVIAANTQKDLYFRFTNVTAGSLAYTVYC